MRQRLGLATALLADPPVIVLDEPANGLDPEGIVWMRSLLRRFAEEGRTVLVSSHVLGEVQHTVDDVVIIAQRPAGARLLARRAGRRSPCAETYVESPDADRARATLLREARLGRLGPRALVWYSPGVPAAEVGAAAHAGAGSSCTS